MKIKDYLTEEKWTQGAYYRDKDGNGIFPKGEAEKCCLMGAVFICYPVDDWQRIEGKIIPYTGPHVVDWNDDPERTFSDVRDLVERLDI